MGKKRSIFRKISFHGSRKKIREQREREGENKKQTWMGHGRLRAQDSIGVNTHHIHRKRGETEPDYRSNLDECACMCSPRFSPVSNGGYEHRKVETQGNRTNRGDRGR